MNLVAKLSAEERARGVVTASTGNHGQSIAFAGKAFGVPVTVYVPEKANPQKLASMLALGAEVEIRGTDFDDARESCEEAARAQGQRYIHSGDEPMLIAGVATLTLELLEQEPRIDVILVPIGGGSGAAGACIVTKALRPETRVNPESSLTQHQRRSALGRKRALLTDTMRTFAEGLATRVAFELPQRILWNQLDDFVLVSDAEIRKALRLMIELTRNLVEPAGAAPLAAALHMREEFENKRVAVICSGGNISVAQLQQVLSAAA